MANPFDQFDASVATPVENPFDRFDAQRVQSTGPVSPDEPFDPGRPHPMGRIERPVERTTGDALKPIFGGHNPIAETTDLAKDALDPRSKRSIAERVSDAANFAVSVPFQMVRAPTPGQMVESATGYAGNREAEERFVQNNPRLLEALDAVGTLGLQTPLGQGARMPSPPTRGPAQPLPAAVAAAEDTTRARRMLRDMETLDVEPYAPVIAAARSSDNSPGALTQSLADKPFVGTPIQRGAKQLVDDMADAQGRIVDEYGTSRTMQGAGANVRGQLEQFREGRNLDTSIYTLENLDDLREIANAPPRLSSFGDVAAAKYRLAEVLLPEEKARGQAVAAGEARQMGGMPETISILRDIKRRYGLTINKSEAAAAKKGKGNTLSLEDSVDFGNPKWTGSANIDRSLDAIISAQGRWRTGLEGMREIRSNIRRLLSSKADTEVNALARGDLKRLYSAVSRDMDGLLERMAQQDKANATRYVAAKEAFKDADAFYKRYSEAFDAVKRVTSAPTDEAAAGAVLTAMKDGSKGNLDLLLTLRKMLPQQVMDDMAGAILVELGRPTGRAGSAKQEAGLSPARFATQWNGLSDAAKTVVFGGRPELKRQLDAFARVAQGAQDFEALANNSRTGVSNMVMGTIAAGGYGLSQLSPTILLGTIATMGSLRAAAHFLTSPTYVRWLTEASRLTVEPRPNQIRVHLRKLENIIRNDANLDDVSKKALMASITSSLAAQSGSEPRRSAGGYVDGGEWSTPASEARNAAAEKWAEAIAEEPPAVAHAMRSFLKQMSKDMTVGEAIIKKWERGDEPRDAYIAARLRDMQADLMSPEPVVVAQ